MLEAFFIVGFVRSGSTALAEAFKSATNADVFVEVAPKLLVESRDLTDGRLDNPEKVLREARSSLIADSVGRGKVFGDKNASYLPFLPWLGGKLWDSKIVFFHRDGRDAVRSLMDWHAYKAKNIYNADVDEAGGVPLLAEKDAWAYFYMRPQPSDPLAAEWTGLSRFEKCAWYWAEYNRQALAYLKQLPSDRWMRIDLSDQQKQADKMQELFKFLGLKGYDRDTIDAKLTTRINSIGHRMGLKDNFPSWRAWPDDLIEQFNRRAGSMMRTMGYSSP